MKFYSHKTIAFAPLMPWTNKQLEIDSSPTEYHDDSQATTNVQIESSTEEISMSTESLDKEWLAELSRIRSSATSVEHQLGLAHSHLSMVKRLVTARQSEYAINYGDFEIGPEDKDLLIVNVSSPLSTTHLIVMLHFGDENTYDLSDSKFALNLAGRHVTLVAGTENLFQRGALVDRQRVDLTKINLRKNEALVVRVKKI
uniref:FHA domain-containing protein n=1 Tax=Romanomermis culicivorax TaxID=13658 RepID=A0A915IHI2_ROMCU